MSKLKIGIWVAVFLVILLFFLHNQEFFMTKNAFDVNIFGVPSLAEYSGLFKEFKTPPVPNVVIFLGFFAMGIAVAYFFNFFGWLRSKRAIKRLSYDCESANRRVEELEAELASIRLERTGRRPELMEPEDEAQLAARENAAIEATLKS